MIVTRTMFYESDKNFLERLTQVASKLESDRKLEQIENEVSIHDAKSETLQTGVVSKSHILIFKKLK